jgi:hypothetical protein
VLVSHTLVRIILTSGLLLEKRQRTIDNQIKKNAYHKYGSSTTLTNPSYRTSAILEYPTALEVR